LSSGFILDQSRLVFALQGSLSEIRSGVGH
jgi:hypothetical protein